MVRGGEIQRKTPLRSAPAKPRTVGAESKPARVPQQRVPGAEPKNPPARTRRLVLVRCGGLCEVCGLPLYELGTHLHHRVRRSQGVLHSPANLIAAHPRCHVLGADSIHENVAWARGRGLLLVGTAEPEESTLTLPSGLVVLLHPTLPEYVEVPEGHPERAAA